MTTQTAKAHGNKGRVFTPEHRAKLSAIKMGRKLSEEHKLAIKEANIGKHFNGDWNSPTEEHREIISRAQRGPYYGDPVIFRKPRPDADLGSSHNLTLGRKLNSTLFIEVRKSEYDKMLAEQNGRCAICLVPEPNRINHLSRRSRSQKKDRRFHIDHNHKTGEIRGLLCYTCNIGLGMFKDFPGHFISAFSYLSKRIGTA